MKTQLADLGAAFKLFQLAVELPKKANPNTPLGRGIIYCLLEEKHPPKEVIKEIQETYHRNEGLVLCAIGEEMTEKVMAYVID